MQNNTFSYLKATTVLFAQKTCEALGDMCGAEFSPLKETIKEGTYASPFNTILFISFTGTIQGYYLLSLNDVVALKLIGAWDETLSPQRIRDLREEFGGMLKEVLNLAVGGSIVELEKSFSNLSFTPCTIVYGEIEFPNIMSGCISIEGREGVILCGFSLNLANLKIGERLEEALKEVELKRREAEESQHNIESILQVVPTGLLTIDCDGIILPGYSASTPTIIGHPPETESVGRFLPEFIGVPNDSHESWKNWFSLTYQKFAVLPFTEIKDLCPTLKLTNSFNRTLRLNWFPITSENSIQLDKLLVVIEAISS